MKLTPRYGSEPIVRIDPMIDGLAATVMKQRDRLAATLADLDAGQWATPSRCEGWSVQDVVIHLSSTNQFWAFSVRQGLAGEPTQFLVGFDPVASPAELVAGQRGTPPSATLAQFVEGNQALADALAAADSNSSWGVLAEAPPGHIAIGLVAIHALWDSWVHERDIRRPARARSRRGRRRDGGMPGLRRRARSRVPREHGFHALGRDRRRRDRPRRPRGDRGRPRHRHPSSAARHPTPCSSRAMRSTCSNG